MRTESDGASEEPGRDLPRNATVTDEGTNAHGDGLLQLDPPAIVPPDPERIDHLPASIPARFEDIRFLGRGGMGTVYRARDKQLTRDVAIKFVHGEHGTRFLREARAQARVAHEQVCKIYDVGLAEGRPYITMQLVEGDPLSSAGVSMTLEQKVKVIREVAAALHEAHRLGLVHRDVKPGNILVERTEDGHYKPYVVDFGLAREAGVRGETMTGEVAGTPSYMAPEQARGEVRSLDRRTDVYSLGSTLYDLLAGHPPFIDDNAWKMMLRVADEDAPPLKSVLPGVPEDLETIVMKCLEREPGRRYESARALGEDLQRYLDGEPVLARKRTFLHVLVERARKHKLLVSLSAIALVAVFVVAGMWIRARRIAAEQARLAGELGEDVKEMQLFVRYAYSLPLHDAERERSVVRRRLSDIEQRTVAAGGVGRGPGHYALGRGYLALQESDEALTHLRQASAEGVASPELAYAMGRALVELYREGLAELSRIEDKKKRAARQAELEAKYKTPALAHMRAAQGSRLEHPAYVEGLIALVEGRHDEALLLAKRAQEEARWFYEATVLEAEIHFAEGSKFRADAAFDYQKMMAHFEPSIEAYRRAAEVGSIDPTVHEGACTLLTQIVFADGLSQRFAKTDFEQAKAACDKAIASSPERGAAYLQRAFAYGAFAYAEANEGGGNVDSAQREAIVAADVVVQKRPEDAFAHWLLGSAWRTRAYSLYRRGVDTREAAERAIASYREALRLDPSFLWPAREVVEVYLWKGKAAAWRGEDWGPWIDQALAALDRAEHLAPGDALNDQRRCILHLEVGELSLSHGKDPEPSVQQAQEACSKAPDAAPDDMVSLAFHSLALIVRANHSIASGTDSRKSLENAERIIARIPTHASGLRSGLLGQWNAAAARAALLRGESPQAHLEGARSQLRERLLSSRGGFVSRLDLVDAELTGIQWAMAKKKVEPTMFTRALDILAPLCVAEHVSPDPFQLAAAIHERHAAWLVARGMDPAEPLSRGLVMVDEALRRNPRMGAALATREALAGIKVRGSFASGVQRSGVTTQ